MAKTSANFRLSKTVKRMIALMKGSTADQRNQFKRMMIDAEYTASIVPKTQKKERGSNYNTTSNSATASAE
jgi:hypothetical protein